MFEDNAESITKDLNDNKSRTNLVNKRSVSESEIVDDSEPNDNNSGWMHRIKRSIKEFWDKKEEKPVKKRSSDKPKVNQDVNENQEEIDSSVNELKVMRKRRQNDDDEDEDNEDSENDVGSGLGIENPEVNEPSYTSTFESVVTLLPAVKDDKYCKLSLLRKFGKSILF